MGHLENKLEWCLRKAKKEGKEHRGLKAVKPDMVKADKHIQKANHNFKAMLYMIKGNFQDWAVSASFYAMYHCLLALLAKHGYESRNQECTMAAVESLIKSGKTGLDIAKLRRIASFDESDMDKTTILKTREEFQYGTDTIMDSTEVKKLVDETKEFIQMVEEEMKNLE